MIWIRREFERQPKPKPLDPAIQLGRRISVRWTRSRRCVIPVKYRKGRKQFTL